MYAPGTDRRWNATRSTDSNPPLPSKNPDTQPSIPTNSRKGPLIAERNFQWPVKGKLLGKFGEPADGLNTLRGIKISVPEGTRVDAAKSGQISWVANGMAGYGKVVMIRHSDGYTSLYAYCSEILVKQEDWVRQGDPVSLSGQTGMATLPCLYFQISKNAEEVNPLPLLE